MTVLQPILLMLAAGTAEPVQPAWFARVDLILVNRVRSVTIEYDAWGRPVYRTSEVCWVSFWRRPYAPCPGGWWPVCKRAWIDCGWWNWNRVRLLAPCSDGWVIENDDALNVVAPDLLVIDSGFDYELRHRGAYRPLKTP